MKKKKTNKKIKRKKPQLKTKKKISAKKPMRSKKRTVKKAVELLYSPKELQIKESEIIQTEVAKPLQKEIIKELPKHTSAPYLRKNYISRHVLDLKKIQAEKYQLQNEREKDAHDISEEVLRKITGKKNQIAKRVKTIVHNIESEAEKLPKISPKKYPQKKIKLKISFPKLDLPDINLPKAKISLPLYWAKAIISFIIICLILISPFFAFDQYRNLLEKKNTILGRTASALTHLSLSGEAASAHDLYYTQFELQTASENFTEAEKELQNINLIIQGLLKITPKISDQYNTAAKLLDAAEKLSTSAANLSFALENFELLDKNKNELNLTEKLSALKDSLNLILPDLKIAKNDLLEINIKEIPVNFQDKIIMLQEILPVIENNVYQFINYSDLALQILGQDNLKRYLILFQNNNELRPTGGFIGSYALVDFDRGNIEKISIPGGGPYDLKAGLKVNISAPRPLRILNQRWEFQDANWFADLPTSADKLIWFYEKSGGPTTDGIFFINASFVEKLLKITGPIDMPEYGKTISTENFINEIQKSVEFEYDKTINKPKQIIADLAPKLIDKLIHADKITLIDLVDLVFNGLNEKEIQLYFTNYSLEKFVLNNNWGGQIKKTDGDYLNIVSTNIAGEKTDAKISQKVNLKVDIKKDGSIINTLTLTKIHSGEKNEALYGVPNVDYLRIYTPKGSEFISAFGFDSMESELFENVDPEIFKTDELLVSISNTKRIEPLTQTEIYYEGDKTVFANWIKVQPGQEKTISLTYKLPFKINLFNLDQPSNNDLIEFLKSQIGNESDNNNLSWYSLILQKQSGKNYDIEVQINLPDTFDIYKIYPKDLIKKNNYFIFYENLNADKLLAIIFNKK
ncbi:DUF4012 domain-containing protein [Candidatus Falkowbacteria bacterium]|nr:DUF4012 domain-containing protein [Candidatus Falkowbacteria bacterium]